MDSAAFIVNSINITNNTTTNFFFIAKHKATDTTHTTENCKSTNNTSIGTISSTDTKSTTSSRTTFSETKFLRFFSITNISYIYRESYVATKLYGPPFPTTVFISRALSSTTKISACF